jgi:hypothetical protein
MAYDLMLVLCGCGASYKCLDLEGVQGAWPDVRTYVDATKPQGISRDEVIVWILQGKKVIKSNCG